jgi:K+ transporter
VLFLTGTEVGRALLHNIKHNQVLHERNAISQWYSTMSRE